DRPPRRVLGTVPSPGLESAAFLLVDDDDAPPEPGGFRLRPQAADGGTRLRDHLRSRYALARRKLRRAALRAAGPPLTMTFSALDSALTGPLFATDAMRAVFSDRARLAAMLKAETALARAEAQFGLVPKALATALARLEPD